MYNIIPLFHDASTRHRLSIRRNEPTLGSYDRTFFYFEKNETMKEGEKEKENIRIPVSSLSFCVNK